MDNIEQIDQNLAVEKSFVKDGLSFFDILNPPFKIYGVKYENGQFRRMPQSVAESVSLNVACLNRHTSGGRVRFKTNSKNIAIKAKMPHPIGKMAHFALSGSAGFDMYICKDGIDRYNSTFVPPYDIADGYESKFSFASSEEREITINFPLYSEVSELYIGLDEGATLGEAMPYLYEKPIVYYGSSITQGGCASRPGNSYPCIISRRFNCDFINLGFSGSAKGEDEIAEYIANLDMKIFVYDYDHNASTAEHLKNTHQKMFNVIREKNPDLPIIMMTSTSMPRYFDNKALRKEIIYSTYKEAADGGDRNVYFLDGEEMFAECEDFGTVEGCHPNDIGFLYISRAVGDTIEKII